MADNMPGDALSDSSSMNTFVYSGPLFLHGPAPGPEHSRTLIGLGDSFLQEKVQATGKEKFEHLVLYCLTLLHRAQGKICAFYVDDFDQCNEDTLRIVQQLMVKAGYTTSDFIEYSTKKYKGFWAWQKVQSG